MERWSVAWRRGAQLISQVRITRVDLREFSSNVLKRRGSSPSNLFCRFRAYEHQRRLADTSCLYEHKHSDAQAHADMINSQIDCRTYIHMQV